MGSFPSLLLELEDAMNDDLICEGGKVVETFGCLGFYGNEESEGRNVYNWIGGVLYRNEEW